MPGDLFRDVTKPSIAIGNRKWYTVPVSMGTHSAVVLALIVLPMLAPGLLPMPDATTVFTAPPPPPPSPPPPVRAADTPRPPAVNPNAAPTEAPTSITEEPEDLPSFEAAHPADNVIAGAVEKGFNDPPPVIAPPPPAIVKVGGQIRQPAKIAETPLVYPQMAITARVEGMVIIEATIGVDGRVSNAKVLRGKPLLDQAALDAVRTWQYTPTLLNGVPVSVIMTVVVQFRLH